MTDPILQEVVRIVEQTNGGISITLTVQGRVITGKLISAGEYIDGVHAQLPSGSEIGKQLGDYLASAKVRAEAAAAPFVHLQDARFFTEERLAEPGVYWRGKLSDVSGFYIGVTRLT